MTEHRHSERRTWPRISQQPAEQPPRVAHLTVDAPASDTALQTSGDSADTQLVKPAPDTDQKRRSFFDQLTKYFGVSFTQTFVEFGVFAGLEALGLPPNVANGVALTCSASYNFLMNRNITFKASSNFRRSVCLFILLYCWNMFFSGTCIAYLPGIIGCDAVIIKMCTMCLQGIWGFFLCRHVIFR